MSPKNEIAPFSLCPTWSLKIVPTSGHYPQQKNSPAFLFTQKSVKMRPSTHRPVVGTRFRAMEIESRRCILLHYILHTAYYILHTTAHYWLNPTHFKAVSAAISPAMHLIDFRHEPYQIGARFWIWPGMDLIFRILKCQFQDCTASKMPIYGKLR